MPRDPFEGGLKTEWWASESDWNAVPVPAPWSVAEEAQAMIASTTARLWLSFADAISQARATPWEWVPCPSGETSPTIRGFAEHAVVADIAVRLHLSESTVRTQAHLADGARARLPELWRWLSTGQVTAQHLRIALDAAAGLEGDPLAEFDSRVSDLATEVSAARLRPRARLLTERLKPASLTARYEEAYARRGVWVEPAPDGMSWLTAHLPAITAARVAARLNGAAGGGRRRRTDPQPAARRRAVRSAHRRRHPARRHGHRERHGSGPDASRSRRASRDPRRVDPDRRRHRASPHCAGVVVGPHPHRPGLVGGARRGPPQLPPSRGPRPIPARPQPGVHASGMRSSRHRLRPRPPHPLGGGRQHERREPAPGLSAAPPAEARTRWTAERDPAGEVRWTSPTGFSARPDPPPF